jgi:hypothetical protein
VGALRRVAAHVGDAVLVLVSVGLAGPISALLDKVLSKSLSGAIADLVAVVLAGVLVFAFYEMVLSRPRFTAEWAEISRDAQVLTDASPAVPVGGFHKWEVRFFLETNSLAAVWACRHLRRSGAGLIVSLADVAGTIELTYEQSFNQHIGEGPDGRGVLVPLGPTVPRMTYRGATEARRRELGRCRVSADAAKNAHDASSDVDFDVVRDRLAGFWNYAVSTSSTVKKIRAAR